MNINAALVKQLRSDKSWSQEELAIACGLNLRTVQRIENEATASMQSKKALAAAFGVAIKDLDIAWKQGFLAGFKNAPLPDLQTILNREGQDGWRLVQLLTPELLVSGKSVEKLVAIFERPVRG